MGFTVKKASEKGSQKGVLRREFPEGGSEKGVSRRCPERPLKSTPP